MNDDDLEALARAAQPSVHVQPRRPAQQPAFVPAAIFVTPPTKPAKQYSPFHWGFGIVLGMVAAWLVIFITARLLNDAAEEVEKAKRNANKPAAVTPAVIPPQIVSAAATAQITGPVTYEQAESVIGCPATSSKDEDDGTVSYTWKNDEESWLKLYFRNGKLTRKSHVGLK